MDLNTDQIKAINGALSNEFIFSITGAAGTGKSTVISEICTKLTDKGIRTSVLSPTGRAADLLRKKIGHGMTIHKFLEYFSQDYGNSYKPRFNYHNQLCDTDYIIIDEASMVDREVWDNLLKACPDHIKICLVGDPNQLAPIEKTPQRSAFKLALEHYPKVELKIRYRFGKQAELSQLSDDVLEGHPSVVEKCKMLYRLDGVTDEYQFNKLCKTEKYWELDSQIICPTYKGKGGCDYINSMCQAHRFPNTEPNEYGIYSGDKVICTMNTPWFYNGNIFFFEGCDEESIYFDRLTCPRYWKIQNNNLDLMLYVKPAYCITTHKSQGGEYQNVVYIISKSSIFTLDRSNIYTGVTRSKENLVVLYDKYTLQKGLSNVSI